jgi:hypothetical protein
MSPRKRAEQHHLSSRRAGTQILRAPRFNGGGWQGTFSSPRVRVLLVWLIKRLIALKGGGFGGSALALARPGVSRVANPRS